MNTEVVNPNKVAFVTVVAILEHVAGTFAEPCTLLNGHGEHWVNGIGGGEVFFECDEFHVFTLVVLLLCLPLYIHRQICQPPYTLNRKLYRKFFAVQIPCQTLSDRFG